MKIAFIAPYAGKQKYQKEYDEIVRVVEENGGRVLSPEKGRDYKQTLSRDSKLHDQARAHYEFMRKSIIDSDAVIVEASWEDFRVGHETTLALLYRKPVLALSQELDLGKYIHHPDFYGIRYEPQELRTVVESFLIKIGQRRSVAADVTEMPLRSGAKTIAVFGAICADIWNKVQSVPHENEVALSDEFKISLGGKATNAAVALARMGNDVYICGRIGYDVFGSDLEAVLIHEGIKTDFLTQDRDAGTGTVTLAVDQRAKYSTIVNEAANVRLTKESVDSVFEEVDAGRLKLDSVYVTLEPQKEIVHYIIREAARRKLFVFCDAAPHARPLDKELLPFIDVVAPNQVEAEAITGIHITGTDDAAKAARGLVAAGAKTAIITLGDQGSYYLDQAGHKVVEARQVHAIDEAGAGDAFRAAYLHAVLHGAKPHAALDQATAAGAYAVTHFGSYASMPSEEQLEALLSVMHAPAHS